MKNMVFGGPVVLMALWLCAAPKNAGYPFDGFTGFSVSNVTERLEAGNFSVAAWCG